MIQVEDRSHDNLVGNIVACESYEHVVEPGYKQTLFRAGSQAYGGVPNDDTGRKTWIIEVGKRKDTRTSRNTGDQSSKASLATRLKPFILVNEFKTPILFIADRPTLSSTNQLYELHCFGIFLLWKSFASFRRQRPL